MQSASTSATSIELGNQHVLASCCVFGLSNKFPTNDRNAFKWQWSNL